ncbi:hypothetical protein AB0451_03500 [Streptomyces sp. NPDC052000]|uniref:hypothetical protein n=1 Tax=Streptomyces sp. NPDC052000 TaxID=3155676 RepID=UPI00344BA06B
MTDYATPDEARAAANNKLAAFYATVTDWTEALFDQALLHVADVHGAFSANDMRAIMPETGRGAAGLYFTGLTKRKHPLVLEHVGDVPSINAKAHGKPVYVYLLTPAGRQFIEARKAARTEQRRAAA